MHITIIAELGSSPAPAWDFAPWCAAAANAGADAVKVQLFRADHFPTAERHVKRVVAFPRERLREFVVTAHAYGLTAGASVFDLDAVTLAAEWCDWLKLAAREKNNGHLIIDALDALKQSGKMLYRSLPDLDHGYSLSDCLLLYAIPKYPTRMVEAIYRVLQAKLHYRSWKWGWSSHTTGTLDCVLAARLGSSVIEKHLALWPTDLEAGHSLLPYKFAAMCRAIRKGE